MLCWPCLKRPPQTSSPYWGICTGLNQSLKDLGAVNFFITSGRSKLQNIGQLHNESKIVVANLEYDTRRQRTSALPAPAALNLFPPPVPPLQPSEVVVEALDKVDVVLVTAAPSVLYTANLAHIHALAILSPAAEATSSTVSAASLLDGAVPNTHHVLLLKAAPVPVNLLFRRFRGNGRGRGQASPSSGPAPGLCCRCGQFSHQARYCTQTLSTEWQQQHQAFLVQQQRQIAFAQHSFLAQTSSDLSEPQWDVADDWNEYADMDAQFDYIWNDCCDADELGDF
ncbi:hypothetical protein DFJ73DRAFT_763643 [Zopfochytrium polystomum]|nr:hypothetical protein DFJ73DRAFT_763643 [Zopfochytrium polystomum]